MGKDEGFKFFQRLPNERKEILKLAGRRIRRGAGSAGRGVASLTGTAVRVARIRILKRLDDLESKWDSHWLHDDEDEPLNQWVRHVVRDEMAKQKKRTRSKRNVKPAKRKELKGAEG